MVVEPHKCPRKRPVYLPSPEVESAVVQDEKRERGPPRLREGDGPVSSPLPEQPEEEEERAGRGGGEEETGGEDEERIGRPHDGSPTWHPGDQGMLTVYY